MLSNYVQDYFNAYHFFIDFHERHQYNLMSFFNNLDKSKQIASSVYSATYFNLALLPLKNNNKKKVSFGVH